MNSKEEKQYDLRKQENSNNKYEKTKESFSEGQSQQNIPLTLNDLDLSKLNLPKETKERLEEIKKKLERFQKEVLEKFDKYIMGIALLPPRKQGAQNPLGNLPLPLPNIPNLPNFGLPNQNLPGLSPLIPGIPNFMPFTQSTLQTPANLPNLNNSPTLNPTQGPVVQENKNELRTLVLVDDSDSQKMTKIELKAKLSQIIIGIANNIDKNIWVETLLLSELWENCYDGKYETLSLIASGTPVYDTGMLAAIKIAEVHKQMVLAKFEKYIVCYVLAGSLVQGKATKDSDIDVFVVIDDTDVKKMSRFELKEKLRAIIIGMGLEAGELTGIRNKINIQVYILTDFWENIKEANPIIFTFLRDGIPFYDRGIFMPWKQLLKMGKIKPSQEAIDIFMQSGDQLMKTVDFKLKTIGMEDTFYAILTPSQAAIMLYGIAPPTPKETPEIMREIFVKKEKLLEEEYVEILEKNIKIRKDLEHGTKKELTGKEVDELVENAKKYLKRIEKLFKQIEKVKEEESLINTYETTLTIVKDVLKLEGIEKIKEKEVLELFETALIDTGKIPHKYLRELKDIIKAKEDYDNGKLTKTDISKVNKSSKEFHNFLIEYIHKKRGAELEKAKIKVKYGDKFGEVILLDKVAFIIHDIDSKDKKISKADLENGNLINIRETTQEELEKALAEMKIPENVFLKNNLFNNLSELFGNDVEILVKN
ncbi:MAG: nucleotidyltransferase domain-containing protein [Candidatus Woesearchaeota archaeon]